MIIWKKKITVKLNGRITGFVNKLPIKDISVYIFNKYFSSLHIGYILERIKSKKQINMKKTNIIHVYIYLAILRKITLNKDVEFYFFSHINIKLGAQV